MYSVILDDKIIEDLEKLRQEIIAQIRAKIYDHLAHHPRELGKRLQGPHKGLYSYRHGNYRIIYRIFVDKKTIVINSIGHRSEVYKI